jgi:hypothetical protein
MLVVLKNLLNQPALAGLEQLFKLLIGSFMIENFHLSLNSIAGSFQLIMQQRLSVL